MKKILNLLVVIVVSSLSIVLHAQTGVGKITGIVKDGSEKTIEAATITLLRLKDSAIVKVGVANKSGQYQFENIADGKYLVSITAVGHQKGYSEVFEIKASVPVITLKTIELVPQSKALAGVSVTAKKPLVEQKIDRMVVNVEASITNVGTSALEVLEKSPGITVDKDGNISLKGKAGVTVLVDGRQTYLSGTDLANMLRSMSSTQLDQIEIMTNPPAKYDAAGNSGIINIKTKKNKQLGYNGSATIGYAQGRYPKFNEGLNFNYRQGKVNIFTNLSHNYRKNFNTLTIQRNFRDKNTKELMSHFDQVSKMINEGNSYNAKVGMDYFASKKTTLGVVFSGFSNPSTFVNRNVTFISNALGNMTSQTKAISTADQKFSNFSTNFNFRRLIDTIGTELTGDLDYITYSGGNNNSLVNSYFNAAGNPSGKADTLLGSLPQDIKIYSGKMDYIHPLKKGARFEAGIKSSFVKTDNNAAYDSVLMGRSVHDYNRSNYFIYQENVNAAYVNLSGPLNKKWNGQLGLRVENTNAKGNQVTTGEKFDRHYTQLFPTAYLQYKPGEKNSFVLNYGRRIRRPDYQSLNPFINFLDRYTYQQGNPNLKPQFSHNVEFSHTYKNFLTTTLNYSRTTDIIQQVLEQNEAKNETYVRQANIARQRQYGISVNASNQFTKWWTSNLYVNVYNNKYDGIVNNTVVSISGTTFTMNGSEQFKFAKTWSAEVSGWYRTSGFEGVILARPMGQMSLGLGKQVMKNKGTVRLGIRDVFYTQKFRAVSKYSNIDAAFQETRDSRGVNIGFSYRFSKGKLNGTPKRRASSASDEQGRVKGGDN